MNLYNGFTYDVTKEQNGEWFAEQWLLHQAAQEPKPKPVCTCKEIAGDDENCPVHGKAVTQ